MIPGNIDFTIYQGSTFHKILQWSASGVPVDLTGLRFRMQIKSDFGPSCNATIYATLDSTDSSIVLTPLEGIITLTITASTTANFNFDSAVYDLLYEDQSIPPNIEPLLRGNILVTPGATRFP